MPHGEPAPQKLHCDKCNVFMPHRTVEGKEYCNTCDTLHPAPFLFAPLNPLEAGYCRMLRDEYERGVLTEYPWRAR